jgi:hypothetical protein
MAMEIRLMCDHGGWPLWDDEGGTGPEHWPGLSPSLVARLAAWDARHSMSFRLRGRARRGLDRAHLAEGEDLCRELADELSPEYVVWLYGTVLRRRGRGTVTEVDEP